MMTKKIPLLLAAGLTLAGCATYPDVEADYHIQFNKERDIETDFNAAVRDAKKSNKRIFVEMGTEWCTDSRKFSAYLANDPELREMLAEHFILLKVRAWGKGKNGVYQRNLADTGCIPAVLITDKDGTSLMFRHGVCFEKGGSFDREVVKDFLLEAISYELPDLAKLSDNDPSTKIKVSKGSLLTVPTETLGPLKGFRIMGKTLGDSADANQRTKFGVAGYPFGRKQRMGLLEKPLDPNNWIEFTFSEPVNGTHFKLGEMKEAVEISGLQLIKSDATPAPSDLSEKQLIQGKIRYQEYHASGWNLPDPAGRTPDVTRVANSFITDLFKNEQGCRPYGFIESSGFIKIERAGKYTFKLHSLGQAKFRLDNKTIINQPPAVSPVDYTAVLNLQAGFYPYQLISRPSGDGSEINLSLKRGWGRFQPVKIENLYIEKPAMVSADEF